MQHCWRVASHVVAVEQQSELDKQGPFSRLQAHWSSSVAPPHCWVVQSLPDVQGIPGVPMHVPAPPSDGIWPIPEQQREAALELSPERMQAHLPDVQLFVTQSK